MLTGFPTSVLSEFSICECLERGAYLEVVVTLFRAHGAPPISPSGLGGGATILLDRIGL